MNSKTVTYLIATAVLVLALLTGTYIGLNLSKPAVVVAPQTTTTGGYAQYSWGWTAVTNTQTGTGQFVADYGVGECYLIVDITDLNLESIEFEHSPNNVTYEHGTLIIGESNTTDFVAFTATLPVYGQYIRPVLTVTGTNPITVNVKCVFKDTQL